MGIFFDGLQRMGDLPRTSSGILLFARKTMPVLGSRGLMRVYCG